MIRGGRPVLIDSGQRYWRFRGNRRLRTARMRHGLGRALFVVCLQIMIALVLAWAGSRAVVHLRQAREFAVDRIEIEGVERASAGEVRRRLSPYHGRNLLDIDLDLVADAAAADPWLESASVRRILPGTLHVTVEERVPRAVAVIGGVSHLVDATGFVIAPSDAAAPMDLPVLTGLEGFGGAALHAALARGVRAVDRLERRAGRFVDEVSELDLSRPDRILVRTVDPGPCVLLDPDRPDRNLEAFLELRREIERRVGLAVQVDLRWSDRLSVTPAIEPVSEPSEDT
jgi:cell division protein FtsQ